MAEQKTEWGLRYVSTTPPNEGLQIMGPIDEENARAWLKWLKELTNADGSPANVEVRLIKRPVTIGDWETTT